MIRAGAITCALAILFGPLYTAPGYDWVRHSVSELAGQATANAWIMRLGLAALGVSAMAAFVANRERFNGFFLLFGLCILLTAIFPHKPFFDGQEYSQALDQWHSLFASLGGFAAVLAFAFVAGRPGASPTRIGAGVLAALYTGLSAAMFYWPAYQGVFQRVIFGTFIAWMLVFGDVGRARQDGSK